MGDSGDYGRILEEEPGALSVEVEQEIIDKFAALNPTLFRTPDDDITVISHRFCGRHKYRRLRVDQVLRLYKEGGKGHERLQVLLQAHKEQFPDDKVATILQCVHCADDDRIEDGKDLLVARSHVVVSGTLA